MAVTIFILNNSKLIISSTIDIFEIWKQSIFPSLFPFFIISDLLINYNFIELVSFILGPILSKLFKINKNSCFIIIMSMISGFPSSAKYIKELYTQNKITKDEANKIILFTHFSNPLFIFGTIGLFLSKRECIIIFISHYITNFIIGLIFRNYNKNENNSDYKRTNNLPFGELITNSLLKNIDTLLLILGVMIFFSVIIAFINSIINIPFITKPILELANGINYIKCLNISNDLKVIFLTGILSFGGLSVHLQNFSILSDLKLNYFIYLLARIIHVIISMLIAYGILSYQLF